jgi:hypothetical protein
MSFPTIESLSPIVTNDNTPIEIYSKYFHGGWYADVSHSMGIDKRDGIGGYKGS